jgi:hypothetical protein
MTTPLECDKCQFCGAMLLKTEGGIDGLPVYTWSCGTSNECGLEQSDECAVRELKPLRSQASDLRSQLTTATEKLTAAEAEVRYGRLGFLRYLVDVVWSEAFEDSSVPATDYAEEMISRAKQEFDAMRVPPTPFTESSDE